MCYRCRQTGRTSWRWCYCCVARYSYEYSSSRWARLALLSTGHSTWYLYIGNWDANYIAFAPLHCLRGGTRRRVVDIYSKCRKGTVQCTVLYWWRSHYCTVLYLSEKIENFHPSIFPNSHKQNKNSHPFSADYPVSSTSPSIISPSCFSVTACLSFSLLRIPSYSFLSLRISAQFYLRERHDLRAIFYAASIGLQHAVYDYVDRLLVHLPLLRISDSDSSPSAFSPRRLERICILLHKLSLDPGHFSNQSRYTWLSVEPCDWAPRVTYFFAA